MGEVMSIFAIVLLIGLVVVSVSKQRAGMTQTKADEHLRTDGANVQRERSMRRRAEAQAASHDRSA